MSEFHSKHIYLEEHDIVLHALDSFTISIDKTFVSNPDIEFDIDIEETDEEFIMPEFQSDTKWIVHIKGKESGDFFVHFFEKSKASHFVMNLFSKIAAAEEAEHNRSNQGGDQNSIEFDYGGEY